MLKAADIMTKDVATIRSAATVAEAIALMRERDWRALIVERRHPQDAYGIVTETDIVYKVVAYGKDPKKVRVYQIMTKPCIAVNPDLGLDYVARLFADNGLLRAPVVQGELLGIISLSDILVKSQCVEHPRAVTLQQDLQVAVQHARAVCAETGVGSEACSNAWNVAEDIEAELAHQRADTVIQTVFEEFCEEVPVGSNRHTLSHLCRG